MSRNGNAHTNSWAVMLMLFSCLFVLNCTTMFENTDINVYNAFMNLFGFVPERLSKAIDARDFSAVLGAVFQTATYQFLHANLEHFSWNVLLLYCLGRRVEHHLGGLVFLAFYLAAGIIGAIGWYVTDMDSAVPLIGASGAVAGCAGGFAALMLHKRGARTWLGWVGMLLVAKFLAEQFAMASGLLPSSNGQQSVAYATHLSGFAFGYLVLYWDIRRNRVPVAKPVRIEPRLTEWLP